MTETPTLFVILSVAGTAALLLFWPLLVLGAVLGLTGAFLPAPGAGLALAALVPALCGAGWLFWPLPAPPPPEALLEPPAPCPVRADAGLFVLCG